MRVLISKSNLSVEERGREKERMEKQVVNNILVLLLIALQLFVLYASAGKSFMSSFSYHRRQLVNENNHNHDIHSVVG